MSLRMQVWTAYVSALDAWDRIVRRGDPLLPPRRLIRDGGNQADFRKVGDQWVRTLVQCAQLKPADRVLDVGCGIGRIAVALTPYLGDSGSYEGFDIVKRGIEWSQSHITPRWPRFRFHFAEVHNRHYNRAAEVKASEYRFPVSDGEFDCVFLTSVFTHMLKPDISHYLDEIARAMKPGARCLITWFLLTERSIARIQKGQVQRSRLFKYPAGEELTTDKDDPEFAIAYKEQDVRRLYAEAGLGIQEIYYGAWCGSPGAAHGQDVIVAIK